MSIYILFEQIWMQSLPGRPCRLLIVTIKDLLKEPAAVTVFSIVLKTKATVCLKIAQSSHISGAN